VLQAIKGAYVWKDMARQCRKYGLEWTMPSRFPRSALLPLRIACLGAEQPWIGAFCRRIATLNFVDDRELEDANLIAQVLTELGQPASQIMADALGDANKLALRAQTEVARLLGIFGAPTCVVEGEIYWGNDRLDDALDHCLERARWRQSVTY
jgi:2-hydroxychromene-2-carboxylate isomerase